MLGLLQGGSAARLMVPRVALPTAWSNDAADRHGNAGLGVYTRTNGGVTFEAYYSGLHVRAEDGRSTGKYYFEGMIFGGSTTELLFGLVTSTEVMSGITFANSAAVGTVSTLTGAIRHNNTALATLPGVTGAGILLCVAVDLDARLVWFKAGSGNWNNNGAADPATGVGGFTLGGSMGSGVELKPVARMGSGSGQFKVGLFTADEHCAFTPPSGFSTWAGSIGGTNYNSRTKFAFEASHRAGAPLTDAELARLDTLITSIDSGTWSEIDYFAVPGCESLSAGVANLKTYSAASLSIVQGILHVPGRGVTAPGKANVSGAYGGNYAVGVENAWTNFLQNDAHMGVYHTGGRYENLTTVSNDIGSTNAMFGGSYYGGVAIRANAATTDVWTDVPYEGHVMWNRTGSAAFDVYRNGVSVKSSTRASVALAANNMKVGNVGVLGGQSLRGVLGVVHLGGALTSLQVTNLAAAINVYMAALETARAYPSATQQFTRFSRTTTFTFGSGNVNFPWQAHDGANFADIARSGFLASEGGVTSQMTVPQTGDIYIPEDVRLYRVWFSIEPGALSVAAPALTIRRNRAPSAINVPHYYTDNIQHTLTGGSTEHAAMLRSSIIERHPEGAESINVTATLTNTITVPLSDNTFLLIEVLERY